MENVAGIMCAVRNILDINADTVKAVDKEKVRRKKIKYFVGDQLDKKDILMLDSRTGKNGNKECCNAIVYTDTPESWATLLSEAYEMKGYITTRKKLETKGHYQLL